MLPLTVMLNKIQALEILRLVQHNSDLLMESIGVVPSVILEDDARCYVLEYYKRRLTLMASIVDALKPLAYPPD